MIQFDSNLKKILSKPGLVILISQTYDLEIIL